MTKKQTDEMPHLTRLEAVILEILLGGGVQEMYGLEIVNSSGGDVTRGSVYVLLSRMEEKKLVTSRREAAPKHAGGMPRVLYQATGFGARAYHSWAAAKHAWTLGVANA